MHFSEHFGKQILLSKVDKNYTSHEEKIKTIPFQSRILMVYIVTESEQWEILRKLIRQKLNNESRGAEGKFS